jgi:predicted transposase YbfD/YdcC
MLEYLLHIRHWHQHFSFWRTRNDPAVLIRAIHRHWSTENALHWVLDVTFHEDDSRVRDRTAARNLALLRKIALNLAARDRGSQTSLRGRRKKAA